MQKTSRNGSKFHRDKFHLHIRKKFFTVRAADHQNSFPGAVVELSLLEVFKMQLDRVLYNLF